MASVFKSVLKKLTPDEVPLGDDKMIIKVKRMDSRYNKRGHVVLVDAGAPPPQPKNVVDPVHEYVLHLTRYYNSIGLLQRKVLDIKSTMLKKVLKEIIEDYPGINLLTNNISLNYPLRVLWYYRDELREARDFEKRSEKGRHLQLLLDLIDEDFKDLDKEYNNCVTEKVVNFDMLWTLFKPKELVFSTYHGQPRIFEVKSFTENYLGMGINGCIKGICVDYNGERFGYDTATLLNPYFEGSKRISDLAVFPLRFHPREQEMRRMIIARGKKLASMHGVNCWEYNGATISSAGHWGSRLYVNGRVMIDVSTFLHYNPDKALKLESLLSDRTRKGDNEDQLYNYDGTPAYPPNNHQTNNPAIVVNPEETGQDLGILGPSKETKETLTLTDYQALLCNSVVWGFAMVEKQWVQFFVDKLTPVVWNTKSFDQLVLPGEQKQLIRALVESHTGMTVKFDDFIAGKGQGLVACLHGPPGSGKTMTAESVAEYTKSPLYLISAGDLGADPKKLEISLSRTLRLCTIWNAVLLLDEADVFLEERSLHDLERNALVSIFLRLLEYYRGILILTTNRVKSFDEAFQSRIHVAIRYRNLDENAREQVWRNFIVKIESGDNPVATDMHESDYLFLRKIHLNGRQIKNAARTALSLAENEGKKLNVGYVKSVLGVVEQFEKDFAELKHEKGTGLNFMMDQ